MNPMEDQISKNLIVANDNTETPIRREMHASQAQTQALVYIARTLRELCTIIEER